MDAVLFVDDEVSILSSLKRGLIDEEYKCFFASSGSDALEIMKNNVISVICTDMRMPEMNGLSLLKEVREKYPKTVRIVLSGYTQLQQVLATINQVDIFKFITKPWKLEEEFKVVIRQALDYYRLQVESEEMKKSLETKNQAYKNILKSIDEVIAGAKTDVHIAKELGLTTVSYINSLLDSDNLLGDIKFLVRAVNKVFYNMMNIIAADQKDVNVKELLEQYVSELKNKKHIAKVDLTDNAQIKKIRIKPGLLLLIMATIEGLFLDEHEKYYLKLLCEHKTIGVKSGQIELTLVISHLGGNNTTDINKRNFEIIDQKIDMLNKYLNDIMKWCNVSISGMRSDIYIGIKMLLQYKESN